MTTLKGEQWPNCVSLSFKYYLIVPVVHPYWLRVNMTGVSCWGFIIGKPGFLNVCFYRFLTKWWPRFYRQDLFSHINCTLRVFLYYLSMTLQVHATMLNLATFHIYLSWSMCLSFSRCYWLHNVSSLLVNYFSVIQTHFFRAWNILHLIIFMPFVAFYRVWVSLAFLIVEGRVVRNSTPVSSDLWWIVSIHTTFPHLYINESLYIYTRDDNLKHITFMYKTDET